MKCEISDVWVCFCQQCSDINVLTRKDATIEFRSQMGETGTKLIPHGNRTQMSHFRLMNHGAHGGIHVECTQQGNLLEGPYFERPWAKHSEQPPVTRVTVNHHSGRGNGKISKHFTFRREAFEHVRSLIFLPLLGFSGVTVRSLFSFHTFN